MGEMNEKDLERVSGGESYGHYFHRPQWLRYNCELCSKSYSECSQQKRDATLDEAERRSEQGEDYRCPYMRHGRH